MDDISGPCDDSELHGIDFVICQGEDVTHTSDRDTPVARFREGQHSFIQHETGIHPTDRIKQLITTDPRTHIMT
jgi:hypothetical protein